MRCSIWNIRQSITISVTIYIRKFLIIVDFPHFQHSSFGIPDLVLTGMSLIVICLPPLFSPVLLLTSLYPIFRLRQHGLRFNSFDEPSSVLNRLGATDTICLLEVGYSLSL